MSLSSYSRRWLWLSVGVVSVVSRSVAGDTSALDGYPHYVARADLAGDLRITCETSAEPLMKLWVERFAQLQPGLELIAKGTSPLASTPMVASGAYEIGFPARELWTSEEENLARFVVTMRRS